MGSASIAILARGPVADLVSAERFEEALAQLQQERDRRPGDTEITDAIRAVRDRALRHALDRLGSVDGVPQAARGARAELGSDEAYLLPLVDGLATIDELLDRSTLGRLRTARTLASLRARGAITIAGAAAAGAAASGTVVPRRVIVADGQASSAALTRTMLRLALGGSAQLETVASLDDLVRAAQSARPDLIVVEHALPGGDGLAALRAVRKALGGSVPALLVASRADLGFVEGRAPERAVTLARPIEKVALLTALGTLGIETARRT